MYIHLDALKHPGTQRLALLGYPRVDTSGGQGNTGGNGGDIQLHSDSGHDAQTDSDTPGGEARNTVAITARGGDVPLDAGTTPAYGGYGGSLDIWTDALESAPNPNGKHAYNSGSIDLGGGRNLNAIDPALGGLAGEIDMFGYDGVTNGGALKVDGGGDGAADGGVHGWGGFGGEIGFTARTGPVFNTGLISARGGSGEYTGGDALFVYLVGPEVLNSADASLDGGDADPEVPDSIGGAGGGLVFCVPAESDYTQNGTLSARGGSGQIRGIAGGVIHDANCGL